MPSPLSICEQAARAGAAVLVEKLGKVQVREKGLYDLVTEADLASQAVIRDQVLSAFPDHGFIGEEDGATYRQDREYHWIADPLDGTTNFVHGVPFFCVSLALVRNETPVAATVFNPLTNECYTAESGGGARLNGQPIRVSRVTTLDRALACVGFPTTVNRSTPEVRVLLEAIERCQAIRRTGSSALNLAFVAAGRFDLLWSFDTKVWDIAAGALLVQEAGGLVTSFDGSPLQMFRPRILASANSEIHERLVEMVQAAGVTSDSTGW